MKQGDIILLNRKGKNSSWYSSCQRFFTGHNFTHSSVMVGSIFNEDSVIESEEMSLIKPIRYYFEEEDTELTYFSIQNISENTIEKAITKLYPIVEGQFYGFLQIFFFIYRWFMERVFRKDGRKLKNPITKGIICSELVFMYLTILSETVTEFKSVLEQYDVNNVHVGDIEEILLTFPNFFIIQFRKP